VTGKLQLAHQLLDTLLDVSQQVPSSPVPAGQ
jgi:phosphopantothenoylcysteine decarboxylase/phosphopantothenate--cysteine ligase